MAGEGKGLGGLGGVVLWLSAAVKFCERHAQTLFSSCADHMFAGINLGPESGFRIYLLCELGLCYLSRELTIGTQVKMSKLHPPAHVMSYCAQLCF